MVLGVSRSAECRVPSAEQLMLLCGLGALRLGFVKELDLSGVLTITDDTLAGA